MNEFVLYEQLCELEDIANQYESGKTYGTQFRETANRIVSRLYRVGVIGEFKRGKSSLVNAIIGAEVLPTDILPMTAAVTRVTYGTERRILIRYKDGTQEERSLEELIDFATKYDPEKERTAERIREIEVTYPSVFCRNHIDILDTPGLNDNDAMTSVTLNVLGEVDAALMVVSANAPLSITEQNLILSLIERRGIRHIIFAVTHIDAVSSRASRQDEVIRFIRGRISGDVLDAAEKRWAEDPYYLEKARRILSDPDIYGVSSVLAMEGFVHDDEELLEQSRFPHFKNELLTLLTAAQSEDIQAEAEDAALLVRDHLDMWHLEQHNRLTSKIETLEAEEAADKALFKEVYQNIQKQRALLPKLFSGCGFDSDSLIRNLTNKLRNNFIRNLGTLTSETYTNAHIRSAILSGAREGIKEMDDVSGSFQKLFLERTQTIYFSLEHSCVSLRLDLNTISDPLLQLKEAAFPEFYWSDSPVPDLDTLVGVNVMEHIHKVIQYSLLDYADEIQKFIENWNTTINACYEYLLSRNVQSKDYSREIQKYKMEETAMLVNYANNKTELAKILAVLGG